MIIVKILGGLGNQMLQYAFYKALIHRGIEAKIDISGFKNYKLHNGYELERVFGVKPNYATLDECYKLGMPKIDFLNRVINRIKRELGIVCSNDSYYEQSIEETMQYLPQMFKVDKDMYLFGYWNSYKYFENIYNEVIEDFRFKNEFDDKNKKIQEKIEKCNSVSIHVRRGDYLDFDIYKNICDKEYYEKAIKYISARVERPAFFIFSNDIMWCKKNLEIKDATYIEGNNGGNSYKDMQLMSLCKHNIIANSTFSTWGGYLNRNKDKIVCAPSLFLNLPADQEDVFPPGWIKIN